MTKRIYLGIHSRDAEFLRVVFSTPFGPEIVTFIDPDSIIELKLNKISENKNIAVIWGAQGITIKKVKR